MVVDDASTDRSLALLRELAAKSPVPMRITRNRERLGPVRSFEIAIALTTSEIVLLCDQDDIWSANKIERMVSELESEPQLLLLHSDARLIDAGARPLRGSLFDRLAPSRYERRLAERGDWLAVLLRRNFVTGATTALRRSLFELARPLPDLFLHDEWLGLIAAALGASRRIDEALIDYRIHAANYAGLRGAGFRARLRAMTSPRGKYHRDRAQKLESLALRVENLGARVEPFRRELVRQSLEHWHRRAGLPSARIARAPIILEELVSHRYGRYSSGLRSALRDLIEPT